MDEDENELETNVEESLTSQVRRIREAFYSFIDRRVGSANPRDVWVEEIYSSTVIANDDGNLFSYPFTEGDDGLFIFEEPESVEIVYLSVESGNAVIGNSDQRLERFVSNIHESEEEIMNEDEVLELEEEEPETDESETEEPETDESETEEPETVQPDQTLQGLSQMIENLGGVEAVESAIASIQSNQSDERGRLIANLAGNDRNPFSPEELETFGIPQLRKLETSYQDRDYSGMGITPNSQNGDGEPENAMPSMWDK